MNAWYLSVGVMSCTVTVDAGGVAGLASIIAVMPGFHSVLSEVEDQVLRIGRARRKNGGQAHRSHSLQ